MPTQSKVNRFVNKLKSIFYTKSEAITALNNKQDKLDNTVTLTFALEDGSIETHTFYEE